MIKIRLMERFEVRVSELMNTFASGLHGSRIKRKSIPNRKYSGEITVSGQEVELRMNCKHAYRCLSDTI